MPLCPLCKHEGARGPVPSLNADIAEYDCPRCGRYAITGSAEAPVAALPDRDRFMLTASCRAASEGGREITVARDNINQLIQSAPRWRSLFDGIDRLMLLLAARADRFLAPVAFDKNVDYPLLCARGEREMNELLNVAGMLHLLDTGHSVITIEGWRRIDELRMSQPRARQAFVAMSFAPEMDAVWAEGIKPGIEETDYYTAFRVDRSEHNEKIDDYIVAQVRRSGLLVADFTGQRGGVYFEAGLALGLGIPVVWTCREAEVDHLHFDTRQYNHIAWATPADLRRRLTDRLVATVVPRGAV